MALTTASAQDLSATELAKLSKPEILSIAKEAKPQELIVELEATTIKNELDSKRSEIETRRKSVTGSTSQADLISINNDVAHKNRDMVSNYKQELATLKSSVFTPLAALGVKVLNEYPHGASSFVLVPDLRALNALLANPLVLKVYTNDPVKVSANWPSSYQDLSIINAKSANAQGYTGLDMMVSILDTGIDASLIPAVQSGASRIFHYDTYDHLPPLPDRSPNDLI